MSNCTWLRIDDNGDGTCTMEMSSGEIVVIPKPLDAIVIAADYVGEDDRQRVVDGILRIPPAP